MKPNLIKRIRRTLVAMRSNESGNSAMLMAIAMPILIGSSGLAVDTAQWYMWKRELQFAVDQAAIAGAWARTSSDTRDNYQTRARQEYATNLQTLKGFAVTNPTVSLNGYAGGNSNSVTVTATASRTLPFSSILTGRGVTVAAFAQAVFAAGRPFSSCILATDVDDSGALTIGGNAVLTASCGLAALSTSSTSVVINGNPTIDAGWVVSAGGIDSWLSEHTDDEIHEYVSGLYDPYATLTPPNNTTSRTYGCSPDTITTKADITTTTYRVYDYFQGNQNTNNPTTVSNPTPNATVTTTASGQIVANDTVSGATTTMTPVVTWTLWATQGNKQTWQRETITGGTVTANLSTSTKKGQANLLPGTYADLQIKCPTVFSSGVYVINGGQLKIPSQYAVTGSGVMFVLKNGASIDITGGSQVNLTAMVTSQLVAAGSTATEAAKLAGMLVFEDRSSSGTTNANRLNGTSTTVLNGTIYLPKSDITFDGTASVTSQCLMIAAKDITIQGTANMSTFCPPSVVPASNTSISSTNGTVKLVA